jgi:hypothetical protein
MLDLVARSGLWSELDWRDEPVSEFDQERVTRQRCRRSGKSSKNDDGAGRFNEAQKVRLLQGQPARKITDGEIAEIYKP